MECTHIVVLRFVLFWLTVPTQFHLYPSEWIHWHQGYLIISPVLVDQREEYEKLKQMNPLRTVL